MNVRIKFDFKLVPVIFYSKVAAGSLAVVTAMKQRGQVEFPIHNLAEHVIVMEVVIPGIRGDLALKVP